LPAVPDAKHACKHPDHSADRAAQHATHRPSRLVAGLCALLDAFDQPLRICRQRCVEKHGDNYPKRGAHSQPGTHWWCRHVHRLLSMVNFDMLDGCIRKAAGKLPGQYRFHTNRVYMPCRLVLMKKSLTNERVKLKELAPAALLHT
jgi:hypothetical protein